MCTNSLGLPWTQPQSCVTKGPLLGSVSAQEVPGHLGAMGLSQASCPRMPFLKKL